jgi:hypothetical protein
MTGKKSSSSEEGRASEVSAAKSTPRPARSRSHRCGRSNPAIGPNVGGLGSGSGCSCTRYRKAPLSGRVAKRPTRSRTIRVHGGRNTPQNRPASPVDKGKE